MIKELYTVTDFLVADYEVSYMEREELLRVESLLKEKSEPVNMEIARIVSSFRVEGLHKPIKYTITGGKRFRPVLTILSCEAVDGCIEDVIPYATAVELIHVASLIYDDLIDRDDLRRFRPTLHRRFGDEVAIICGATLYSKAAEILSRDNRLAYVMSKTMVKMSEGQALDIFSSPFEDLSEERYLDTIRNKTASLMSASTEIGGIIGGAPNKYVSALSNFGLDVGTAYQIRDDTLGLLSSKETIGKSVRSDLSRKKLTLYLIHGFQNLEKQDKLRLQSLIKQYPVNQKTTVTSRDVDDEIIEMLKKAGSIEYAMTRAMDFIKRAKERLYVLSKSNARDTLEKLAEYAVMRER